MVTQVTPGRAALWGLAFTCASVSILALLIHGAGWLPMSFLVNVTAGPSLTLLLALGVLSHRINERVFFTRLVTGAWGGLAATVCYDLIRYAIWLSGAVTYDPFISHPIFGRFITGQPEHTVVAKTVGWAYHFWNGFGFGIMYTLVAGPARWYYAFIWAMFLELAWLAAMPSIMQFKLNPQFLAMSLIGHGLYGIVLGAIATRFIRE
jgi:hypothetical protein